MKLGLCLFNYFPHGGMQRTFLRIAMALLARGHTVDVYTLSWDGEIPPGITVHKLSVKGLTNHTKCLNFSKLFWETSKEKSYDLLIGFNKMPHLDIYYAADTCFVEKYGKARFLMRFFPRFRIFAALERAVFSAQSKTHILCISLKEKAIYQQYYQTPETRFHCLPPGIALDRVRPRDAAVRRAHMRQRYQIAANQWIWLLVAARFKTKGLDRAIHSLARQHQRGKVACQLWVVGGDDPKPYQRLAKRLGVHHLLHFMGAQTTLIDYYLAADLLVHPARVENTGNVLLEALLAGLPVLTTAVCGYAFHVEAAQAGALISSPFVQSAMDNLLDSLLDETQLKTRQINALHYVAGKDFFSLIEKAVEIIECLGRSDA